MESPTNAETQFFARTMRNSDLDLVVQNEAAAYEHPWTKRIFIDCLRAGYQCWVLARLVMPHPIEFRKYGMEPFTPPDLTADQLAAVEAERDARPTAEELSTVEAERDARPTADQLAAVEAERDARYTEDQIRGLSADYTIGLNDAGNVQMKFNLFESADLNTFAPLTLNPDSVSVVDGSICLEFAPEDRAAFFRFSVE